MKKNGKAFRRLFKARVTRHDLEIRANASTSRGYPVQKWIKFCLMMLDLGFEVIAHEAATTRSKYITVRQGRKAFKVRFSNHRPNKSAEFRSDSDFYVGVANQTTTTTEDAIRATLAFFERSNTDA